MTTEKALELVKKLFALADSDNEHEAQDALIKAQGIMLKYHLEQTDIKPEKELADRMTTTIKFTFRSEPWASMLAQTVAENFRCRTYLAQVTKQTYYICLIGNTEDLVMCNMTLKYAYESIVSWCENNKKILKRNGRTASGIRLENNGYAIGFIDGLRAMFEEQRNSDKKYEIVLQTPQSVLNKMNDLGLVSSNKRRLNYNKGNYDSGYNDGRACNLNERVGA